MALELSSVPVLLALAGTALVVAEALAPGAHFMVLGIALLGAGIVGILFPGPLSPIILAALSILFGGAAFYFYRNISFFGQRGKATIDSDRLSGKVGVATKKITRFDGEVKLDVGFNPYYSARSYGGDEIEEGTEVIVIDPGGGNVLKVEPIENIDQDEIDAELEKGKEIETEEVEEGSDEDSKKVEEN